MGRKEQSQRDPKTGIGIKDAVILDLQYARIRDARHANFLFLGMLFLVVLVCGIWASGIAFAVWLISTIGTDANTSTIIQAAGGGVSAVAPGGIAYAAYHWAKLQHKAYLLHNESARLIQVTIGMIRNCKPDMREKNLESLRRMLSGTEATGQTLTNHGQSDSSRSTEVTR